MYGNKNKLNRSNSESDLNITNFDNLSVSSPSDFPRDFSDNLYSPIVRRVYVEEIFSNNIMKRTRKTRYSQFLDDSPSNPIRIRNEDFISAETTQDFNYEDIPMEVDNSYDERFPKMVGAEYMNKSLKRSVLEKNQNKIKTHIPKERETRVIHINPVRKQETKTRWLWLLVPIILTFLYFNCENIFVNSDIQIEHIKSDLMNNLHGHKPVIESIVHMLENRHNWEQTIKLLIFVGSQGVGKTFTANLIKKHFSSNLIHEIYGSQLYYSTEKQKILNGIKSCCLNLLIIDDLMENDNDELNAFIFSLPKDSFILVIAIYNIHYSESNMNTVLNQKNIIKIRDSFDFSGIKNYELLIFEDLTQEQIKDWLKKQLFLKNISLDFEEQILQTVLSAHNVKHGLKGLHSKLILELEKYRK